MEIIRIGFVGSLAPIHLGIEVALLDSWAHCWGQFADGSIIDATARYGVEKRDFQNYGRGAWRADYDLLGRTSLWQREELGGLLMLERGKPYDHKWVRGLPLNRNWQDPNAWSCSELQADKLIKVKIIKPLKLRRVTPGRLLDELQDTRMLEN